MAISRSLALSPQLSAASAAIIDALEAEPSGDAAVPISEDGAVWISRLEALFDALESAIDAVEERIDRRALLRFIERVLPLLLAVYAIVFAHISSDQMNSRMDGVESTIEEHRSETSQEHDELDEALNESMGRLESRLDALSDQLEEQREEGDSVAFYVVVRPVPLTEERRYHSARITWLLPGQEVELVERSKKWLRVIAYDLESGETHVGWVLKNT